MSKHSGRIFELHSDALNDAVSVLDEHIRVILTQEGGETAVAAAASSAKCAIGFAHDQLDSLEVAVRSVGVEEKGPEPERTCGTCAEPEELHRPSSHNAGYCPVVNDIRPKKESPACDGKWRPKE